MGRAERRRKQKNSTQKLTSRRQKADMRVLLGIGLVGAIIFIVTTFTR